MIKKLGFVQAYHLGIGGKQQNIMHILYYRRADPGGIMRNNLLFRIARINMRFKYFYFLMGYLSTFQAPDKFFSFAGEHTTTNHFYPAFFSRSARFYKHIWMI